MANQQYYSEGDVVTGTLKRILFYHVNFHVSFQEVLEMPEPRFKWCYDVIEDEQQQNKNMNKINSNNSSLASMFKKK